MMNIESDKKFTVYGDTWTSSPFFRHDTEEGAIRRAEELATFYPDEKFYVLECKSVSSSRLTVTTKL